MFGAAFSQARFKPIRSISNAMLDNRVEHLLVKVQAIGMAVLSSKGNNHLKCFQSLDGALETNRAWFDIILDRGLSNHRANQIVRHDVRPYFLANQFRCFASQYIHLHGSF